MNIKFFLMQDLKLQHLENWINIIIRINKFSFLWVLIKITSLRAFSIFKKSSTFLSIREGDWKSNLLLKTKKINPKKFYSFWLTEVIPQWNLIISVIRVLRRRERSFSNHDNNIDEKSKICTSRTGLQINYCIKINYFFNWKTNHVSHWVTILVWQNKKNIMRMVG